MEPNYWSVSMVNKDDKEEKHVGLWPTYEAALQTVKALALSQNCEALPLDGDNRHGGRLYYQGVIPTNLFYLIEPVY